ncbi:hypothetical protein [Amycolatopsis sp. NPDC004079]|uniref:hypothetical protein n=1 Tax=Amycolatopsis sp. NPDC004079 TaxID=3154549 RepID=UPI0033A47B83
MSGTFRIADWSAIQSLRLSSAAVGWLLRHPSNDRTECDWKPSGPMGGRADSVRGGTGPGLAGAAGSSRGGARFGLAVPL